MPRHKRVSGPIMPSVRGQGESFNETLVDRGGVSVCLCPSKHGDGWFNNLVRREVRMKSQVHGAA